MAIKVPPIIYDAVLIDRYFGFSNLNNKEFNWGVFDVAVLLR